MDWSSKKRWATRIGASAVAFVLGASASAGTLYSWKTEDGTFAYTNEQKRIPARYKGEAKTTNLGKMEAYERFTPGPKVDDKDYTDRIVERLDTLRGGEARVVVAAADTAKTGPYVRLGVDGRSRTEIDIPVGAMMDDQEPIVVEKIRMRPTNGRSTTRHFKVVRQGDQILAVIKDSINDHGPSGDHDESDYDADPFE
ncbi:MAG: hypothetical protein GY944_08925 [bacterium]|nr:hypothetical protein [bacterium]